MPNINEMVRHVLKIFCSIAIMLITNTYISLELSRLIREKYSYNASLLSNSVLLCLTQTWDLEPRVTADITDNTFPARLRTSDWSIGHAKAVGK